MKTSRVVLDDIQYLPAMGYVRVSTEEQARHGVSLDAQEAKIRAYAQAKDLKLAEVIRDEGASGKDLERAGIQRIVKGVRDREIGAVVVVKLDRLTRRTRDLLYLVEDVFEPAGAALHSLQETVDTRSASGRFFVRLMGALAEMERELIGERTAAALAHKKARGDWLGGVPLGFTRSGPGAPLEPAPEELEIVGRILGLWRRGMSFSKIAEKLNADGSRTKQKGRWYHGTVAKVVRRRELYRGLCEAA